MKTLKKTLCVVLAVVMAVGTLAISASATDFIDDADITYNEAVEMLTGLNVINGKDGNKFDPKGTLTRAEAAKIIVAILVGGDDNELTAISANASQVYSDVPATNWAAGYIEYLTNKGVVSGSNGKFMPEDELSSAAFTKMLLVALGYDADIEGMTGNSWIQNVNDLAKTAGIKDTTIGIGSASITRDEACQLAFLALTEGGMVKYQGGTSITVNGATITSGATLVALDDTGYEYYFDGHVETGYVASNGATVAGQKTTILNCGCIYNKATGVDLIGHVVDVYYKTKNATGTTYAIVDNTTEVAITASMTAAQVKAALVAAGVTTDQLDKPIFQNGVISTTTPNVANYDASAGTLKDETDGTPVDLVGTVLVYNNAIIGVVKPTTYIATKVTAIGTTAGSETITLATGGALNNNATTDVVNEYDGIAVGDIVIDVVCGSSGTAVHNLSKATTVEGNVTKKAGTTYTVGGIAYDRVGEMTNTSALGYAAVDFENTYVLYVTPDGEYFGIVAKTDVAVASDIVYVNAVYSATTYDNYGAETTYTYAQTVALDGTEGKVLIGVNATSGVYANTTGVTTLNAGLYTFATDTSSGSKSAELGFMKATGAPTSYSTTAQTVATAINDASLTLTTASKSVTIDTLNGSTKAYLNSATKYIFIDGAKASMKVNVVTGGINSAVADNSLVLCTKDADGNNIVSAIIIAGTYTNAGVTSSDYIYVATAQTSPAQVADGYEYTVYNAATGAKSTIVATNSTVANAGFYTYKIVDGIYTLVEKTSDVSTGNGTYYAEVYTGKIGTEISSTNITDVEAGSAVVVDTRSASTITSSGIAAVTDISGMHALLSLSTAKTATFDCIKGADGITIIFITSINNA